MEATDNRVEDQTDVDEGDKNMQNDENDRKASRRSFVWDHFTYVKGAKKVKCPNCRTVLACDPRKNGTSGLVSHLQKSCQTSPVLKKQSTLNFKPKGKGGSLASHTFNQERCRRSLVRLCIKDNQPFSIVDNEGFRESCWEMNPMFKIPSRRTLARDCIAMYKEEALEVKELLKDQTVSFTTDTWSSVQNVNYMCLTAHWIDDNWELKKKILNFCPIGSHTGEAIGKMVYACLQKWGVERVFTITVDNASSNDTAIRFLTTMLRGPHAILNCKYIHLRCAHIVNLVVRDHLDEHHDSISRIRNAVRYVKSSPAKAASFQACQKKPCLDMETRWKSTYFMLETAEKCAFAFDRLKLIDQRSYFVGDDDDETEGSTRKRRRTERVSGAPEEKDWEKARQFTEYLRVVYDVTNMISALRYVTSNIFLEELVTMHATIAQMCSDIDPEKQAMARSMKTKYDKYWDNIENINFLLYVAVVLDPRNKMCYLEWCLGQVYGMNSDKAKEICKRVVETMNELFDHYKQKEDRLNAKNSKSFSSSTSNATFSDSGAEDDFKTNFLKYLEDHGYVDNKTEVEIYLGDGMEKRDGKFDILGWWKVNAMKFPILSKIARHVLAMPISTVASELAFSTGSRVIDPFRSSLTPKTAEALICTQDWIRRTPIDIELLAMSANAMEELQEKLEKTEIDEFTTGEKLFGFGMDDE